MNVKRKSLTTNEIAERYSSHWTLFKNIFRATMLISSWSLLPMAMPVAHSQPVPPPALEEPVPPPTVTPSPTVPMTEAERAREAERLRQAERVQGSQVIETRVEHKQIRPSESYVAGFGGYTFGGEFNDVEGTGSLGGLLPRSDRNLADSVVYGGKIGHFFGDRLDWLGVEMEAFNTTPHVEQQGAIPGNHLRVTTLAFNVTGRLKFGCETKTERTETRLEPAGTRTDEDLYMERQDPATGEIYRERRDSSTGDLYRERRDPKTGELFVERRDARTGEVIRTDRVASAVREIRHETRYEREFCRLQPYAGVGLGVFFANLSGNGIDASDNAVPGLNVLGGARYYFTERVAVFAEYKYNRATFEFEQNVLGGGAKGDYNINHVVGGLSLHF